MKKQFLLLLLALIGVTGAWAQSVSFEHNDWRAQQYDYDFTTTSFYDMFVPTNVRHYYDCNSDWLKNGVANYSGELPEGTDNYQLFLSRMNTDWMAASLFDWFTMTAVTPAYTQYTYTIHFKVKCTQQLVTNTIVRAALFDYHGTSNAWLGRLSTPNRYNYFYTAQNDVTSQDQVLGDEICAARMVGTTEPYESTCDVSFTRKSNYGGTLTSLHHFGFSSSRSLGPKSSRCAHRTFLYACVTPHFDGYVKHVVYQPNAGTESEYTNDIIRSGSIQSNQFTRTGYTFANWNTKADGTGTTYNEGDVITVDESTKGQMTLYAQWVPNSYTVNFNKQGGTDGSDNVIATFDAAMPQIATPTRSGYGFYGYFSEPNGNGTRYYDIYGTSTHAWDVAEDNVTLYACWGTPVSYIDADGSLKYVGQYEPLTNGTTTLSRGWYLVTGTVTTNTLDCEGDVKIILADGAKLTATGDYRDAGIRVSAEGASLTIYGQQNQTGQLIATGGYFGSGIGGADNGSGHDITINGGVIIASGEYGASAIGSGNDGGVSSNIFVNSSLVLYADGNNPPTTIIRHATSTDASGSLFGKQYAIVRKPVKGVTITFDKQSGTGGTNQITVDEGFVMPDISVPERDGYAFVGYFSSPDGTGTKYYTCDGTCDQLWNQAENVTLYAYWTSPVPYIDADGTTKYAGIDKEITNETTTLRSGWYLVNDPDVQTRTLVCDGAVHLILADDAKLTATGGDGDAGIRVSAEGASLTIYGQTNQTGQLIANGGDYASGIGGADEGSGHDITINGGVIIASGGYEASAIGGGQFGSSSNIFVNSSLVLYADGNNPPATFIRHATDEDVSGSLFGKQYAIVRKPVMGIIVTFDKQDGTGGDDQITANENEDMPQINVPTRAGYCFQGYYAGENGTGIKYYNADGTSANPWNHTESATLYAHWSEPVPYIGTDGETKYTGIDSEIINTTSTLNSGWYIVRGKNITTGTIVCNGEVNLILADGAKLTATGGDFDAGIRVSAEGASLTIYGQKAQNGQLIATGDIFAAGIGGADEGSGHDITINGGVITAQGGYFSAGIGGGSGGSGHNITINGGVIIATGGGYGAGIGGGAGGSGHNITINGGVIIATGGDYGAGIGGGNLGSGQNITINGGVITTTGGQYAAGIGGGDGGSGQNITINGGVITTTGGQYAAGIGGGDGGSSSNIHINAALILKADNDATPTTEIEHTSTVDLASALSGKQYATLALPTVTVNHASDMNANFGTFYHAYAAYTVPNVDATIYTASVETVNNETYLVLHEIEGDVIPAATPVILRTDGSTTIDLQPCADASGILIPQNSLSGTNVNLTVAANTVYTLASEDNVLAFYEFGRTEIPAHKAYLQLPAGTPAPRRITFGSHVVTDLNNVNVNANANKFILNGQFVIVKDGKMYNAQGAIINNQ